MIIGRSRLPPAATMCPASCETSSTGLCMRSTIVRLTASMSAAVSAVRLSSDGRGCGFALRASSTTTLTCFVRPGNW